jgi:hypothetical protein
LLRDEDAGCGERRWMAERAGIGPDLSMTGLEGS